MRAAALFNENKLGCLTEANWRREGGLAARAQLRPINRFERALVLAPWKIIAGGVYDEVNYAIRPLVSLGDPEAEGIRIN